MARRMCFAGSPGGGRRGEFAAWWRALLICLSRYLLGVGLIADMGADRQLGVEHYPGHSGVIAALTCHREEDSKDAFASGLVTPWVAGMRAGADHLLDRFGHRQFVDIDPRRAGDDLALH